MKTGIKWSLHPYTEPETNVWLSPQGSGTGQERKLSIEKKNLTSGLLQSLTEVIQYNLKTVHNYRNVMELAGIHVKSGERGQFYSLHLHRTETKLLLCACNGEKTRTLR